MIKTRASVAYLLVAAAMLLTPCVGMLWYRANPEVQTSDLATWPAAHNKDGSLNVEFLSEAGEYFSDHFAYRPELITLHAQLQTGLLGVSPTDQVIFGTNGWLYYGGTLNDFLGPEPISERALFNEAHNLRLLQDKVQAAGARFALVVVPNKNSVYPQQMPWWYQSSLVNDPARLAQALTRAGVTFIDLYDPLRSGDAGPLYLQRDSHWNNRGALLAYQKIMGDLKLPALSLTPEEATARTDHLGDLEALLFPTAVKPETNFYFDLPAYTYAVAGQDVETAESATINPTGSKTLLMYRDSFANALIPFLSASFNQAYYSKLLPYDLSDLELYRPDVVLVESAQRSMLNFSANPPAFAAPVVPAQPLTQAQSVTSNTTITTTINGPYLVLSGLLDTEFVDADTRVFVRISPPNGGGPEASVDEEEGQTAQTGSLSAETEKAAQLASVDEGDKREGVVVCEAFLTTSRVGPNAKATISDFGYQAYLPLNWTLNNCRLDVIITTSQTSLVMQTLTYLGE
ncbi:MAG: hypothetical protein LBU07_01380 [Coriobacteriales bacterium]|jgi:hypothetical protein|nr:hypothetical protein [Coriobacteriales bacterium]